MKKVISFCLYGTDNMYLVGAVENAKLQPVIYPGWVCRFYVSRDVPAGVIGELKKLGCEIVETKKPGTYRKAMYWRMEAAFDKGVDRFIVRDCDSRLNVRESAAVKEWEYSGKPFHLMRDHRRHTAKIMGGMWGAVHGFFPGFDAEYDAWVIRVLGGWNPPIRKGKSGDQEFLADKVWPVIKDNHLAHDDRKSKTGLEVPFGESLPGKQFVGQQYTEDNKPVWVK